MSKTKFNFRGFISLFITAITVFVFISGIILYLAPHCGVARWLGWEVMGLSKENWSDLHIVLGFIFLIGAVLHLIYNWRTLLAYLKQKAGKSFSFSKELITALILTAVVFMGTMNGVPPFNWILDLGNSVKVSWKKEIVPPPFIKAQYATINEFGRKLGISSEIINKAMQDAGLKTGKSGMRLVQIARINQVPLQEIFSVLQPLVSECSKIK